ncbi:hypothetical protein BJX76DRAFT_317800 [Aspergillus varians]
MASGSSKISSHIMYCVGVSTGAKYSQRTSRVDKDEITTSDCSVQDPPSPRPFPPNPPPSPA